MIVFILLLLVSVLVLQVVQLMVIALIGYRLTQDKHAAVGFCKSVWFQVQEEFLKALVGEEKKEIVVNK
jgi:hypothetical protein